MRMGVVQQILDMKIITIFTIAVLHLPLTQSQSYIWSFGDTHPSLFSLNDFRQFNIVDKSSLPATNRTHTDTNLRNTPALGAIAVTHLSLSKRQEAKLDQSSEERDTNQISVEEDVLQEDNTTKIIFIRKSLNRDHSDFSNAAMDVITIVWYVATFLALAAFFMLMACSDRRCNDTQRSSTGSASTVIIDQPIAPPTPSPSYSEFAPPSYESVIKMQQEAKTSIFVIPFPPSSDEMNKDNSQTMPSAPNASLAPATPIMPPPVTFYTVNEVQKISS